MFFLLLEKSRGLTNQTINSLGDLKLIEEENIKILSIILI